MKKFLYYLLGVSIFVLSYGFVALADLGIATLHIFHGYKMGLAFAVWFAWAMFIVFMYFDFDKEES